MNITGLVAHAGNIPLNSLFNKGTPPSHFSGLGFETRKTVMDAVGSTLKVILAQLPEGEGFLA